MGSLRGWFGVAALAIVAAGAGIVLDAPGAAGQGRLRCSLQLSQQRPPRDLSERQLIQWFGRSRTKRLQETTAEPLDERKWRAEMLLSCNQSIGDLEYHVMWYSRGRSGRDAQRFIADQQLLVNDRTQKTVLQRVTLPRGQFPQNQYVEGVAVIRRQEVGRTGLLALLGEEPHRSGTVEFSDSETR